MTKKSLVTGGLGYIGSHFCVEAINKKYSIIAIDNFEEVFCPPRFKFTLKNSTNYTL